MGQIDDGLTTKKNLNGSVGALAEAFRGVIVEAVQPIHADLDALQTLVAENHAALTKRIDTTDKNMAAQFAQNRKDIAADVQAALNSLPAAH